MLFFYVVKSREAYETPYQIGIVNVIKRTTAFVKILNLLFQKSRISIVPQMFISVIEIFLEQFLNITISIFNAFYRKKYNILQNAFFAYLM